MKLSELLKALPNYKSVNLQEDIEILDMTDDSRDVEPGALFVCMDGLVTDGHDYAAEAVENGAVAIVAEKRMDPLLPVIYVKDTIKAAAMLAARFFAYPTRKLPVIGVTGTNGKTTVTYLLEAIFMEYGMKTGVIGTIQLKIGSYTETVDNTTPNALFLQKTFSRMLSEGVDIVFMEVSSHALDMGRVYGTEFMTTIYTNISQDHLDYHKTMTDYLHAKSLLFSQMGNQYEVDGYKYAILNNDDSAAWLMQKSTAQPVLTYGTKTTSDIRAKDIKLGPEETAFTLQTDHQSVHVRTGMLGSFNVYNMLAAAGAALAYRIPLACIKQALGRVPGVPGRFERVEAGQSFSVIVDYAHTPDSLLNVLQTIKQFVKGHTYVVVGCGGDRDRTKRPLMAATALKLADWCFFTSDNPRTEDPQNILRDMTAELNETHYSIIEARNAAIQAAIRKAEKGDVVLIAGKGHETYQQIGFNKVPFDDRKAAIEAIENKEL